MALRPERADYQRRRIPPGELSIDPVADERLVRVTCTGWSLVTKVAAGRLRLKWCRARCATALRHTFLNLSARSVHLLCVVGCADISALTLARSASPNQRRRNAAQHWRAVEYVSSMGKQREARQHWQRAAKLILSKFDVVAVSRSLEFALLVRTAPVARVALCPAASY